MKWTEGSAKGFETLYCQNKYDGKLIVHPNGIWSFLCLALDPKGPRARKNNRHTVDEAGIGFILETTRANYLKAKDDTECTFMLMADTMVQNGSWYHLRALFPKNKGYYGNRSDLYFSKTTALPEKVIIYGWDDSLVESYYFHDMNINPGLTEKDFETTNKEYGFHGPIINY
jgi:hypothetical protein